MAGQTVRRTEIAAPFLAAQSAIRYEPAPWMTPYRSGLRPGTRAGSEIGARATSPPSGRSSRPCPRSTNSLRLRALDTGAFEYADALGKFLPDADRPNAGVFALQDDDDQWMALRYDLTAPLARFAAENWDEPAQALPPLRLRHGLARREAGPGPVPAIRPVRRRHRRLRATGGRRGDHRHGGGGSGGRRLAARPAMS